MQVAPIKEEDQLLNFKTEIEILKSCVHENLTNFVEAFYDSSEGNLWIIIESCGGGSVNDILRARKVHAHMCSQIFFLSFIDFLTFPYPFQGWLA